MEHRYSFGPTVAYAVLVIMCFFVAFLYQDRDDQRCESARENVVGMQRIVDAVAALAISSVQPENILNSADQERLNLYLERVEDFQRETKAQLTLPEYCD